MAYLSIGAVRANAFFASGLRRRDEFSPDQVRQAVSTAIRPREAFADPGRLMEEGMIQAQTMAARIACARMTMLHLTELHESVERACRLTARSQWDRKAAAHAEIFRLLADVVDDPLLAPQLTADAASVREVMLAVGHVADGMIVSSRRRLLAHLRAGDGEGAALEMEEHLRVLLYMRRLALPSGSAIAIEAET